MDYKYLEPGHVAIENNQSLKFARSYFTRHLLSVSTQDKKLFICRQFLVPCCRDIIIAPNNTIRYAKYVFIRSGTLKTRNWKTRDHIAGVENAGLENAGQDMQGWKTRDRHVWNAK